MAARIAEIFDGEGADIVFETAGSIPTIQQTPFYVRRGGTITLVGMCGTAVIPFNFQQIMMKEIQIRSVFRYRNLYPTAIAAISSGSIDVYSGGTAKNINVYANGGVIVSSGGTLLAAAVNSDGAITALSGAKVQDTVIKAGGILSLDSGTVHKGVLTIENGAFVNVQSGVTVDFTLAGRTENDDYLINDLAAISGNPVY